MSFFRIFPHSLVLLTFMISAMFLQSDWCSNIEYDVTSVYFSSVYFSEPQNLYYGRLIHVLYKLPSSFHSCDLGIPGKNLSGFDRGPLTSDFSIPLRQPHNAPGLETQDSYRRIYNMHKKKVGPKKEKQQNHNRNCLCNSF